MQITIIGIISIILSGIAFLKKNDNMLLYLVIIFSIFTASIAIDTFVVILPFEIPMVLWISKVLFFCIKNNKNNRINELQQILKKNKLFKAFLFFVIIIIVSELYLLLSNIHYPYVDNVYKDERIIELKLINITQAIRVIVYFVFCMILSIKIKSKYEIKKIIKVFGYATLFAVIWGLIQYILFYFNIAYPSFLFNNNPYAAQGYNQMVYGIKRICSIGTEPSVFAMNLIVFLPILIIYSLNKSKNSNKYEKILLHLIVVLVIICIFLTTSFTAILATTLIMGIFILYYLINYLFKNKKDKNNRYNIIMIFLYLIISISISLALFFVCNRISKNRIIKEENENKNDIIIEEKSSTIVDNLNNENNENNESNIEDNQNSNINSSVPDVTNNIEESKDNTYNSKKNIADTINTLLELTIYKINSGSGQERYQREIDGIKIYKLSPVFGVGYFSYRTFTLFTNILVNMGIIGLFVIFYLFFVVIRELVINRNKDKQIFLMFLVSIIGMLIAYTLSIPDLSYIYCWIILICAYKYFNSEGE